MVIKSTFGGFKLRILVNKFLEFFIQGGCIMDVVCKSRNLDKILEYIHCLAVLNDDCTTGKSLSAIHFSASDITTPSFSISCTTISQRDLTTASSWATW